MNLEEPTCFVSEMRRGGAHRRQETRTCCETERDREAFEIMRTTREIGLPRSGFVQQFLAADETAGTLVVSRSVDSGRFATEEKALG